MHPIFLVSITDAGCFFVVFFWSFNVLMPLALEIAHVGIDFSFFKYCQTAGLFCMWEGIVSSPDTLMHSFM